MKPPKKGTVAWQAYKAEQRLATARAEISRLQEELAKMQRAWATLAMQTEEFHTGLISAYMKELPF